ncbi:hypothetical protein CMI37_29775 [Candidatus Pacearchaeota archaeon]|nr:hypothetical protein [Candidatus Pacearchaeota archaeon]|tara:strand:- start:564 stop:1457 length:894 start_codon:yes stop_codon:yes gene_type:complete
MNINEVDRLILFIDSAKATRLSHDNFEVLVKNRTMECNDDEYIMMEITESTMRRDFYSVQSFNKHFDIFYSTTGKSYNLTEGNPSSASLDSELKTDFENEFSISNGHTADETFTVSWSVYTGKITISSTFTGTVPSDLALDTDVANSCYEVIGFSKGKHEFTIDGQNISLTGDLSINVLGEQNVYMRVTLSNSNFSNNTEGLLDSDIVAKFPILVQPYSNMTFFNTGNLFTSRIMQNKLTGFRVRLTNENDELIGLNSNFTCTLTFKKYRISKDEIKKSIDSLLRLERLKLLKNNIT